jgi:hypothetical protein
MWCLQLDPGGGCVCFGVLVWLWKHHADSVRVTGELIRDTALWWARNGTDVCSHESIPSQVIELINVVVCVQLGVVSLEYFKYDSVPGKSTYKSDWQPRAEIEVASSFKTQLTSLLYSSSPHIDFPHQCPYFPCSKHPCPTAYTRGASPSPSLTCPESRLSERGEPTATWLATDALVEFDEKCLTGWSSRLQEKFTHYFRRICGIYLVLIKWKVRKDPNTYSQDGPRPPLPCFLHLALMTKNPEKSQHVWVGWAPG